MKRAWIIGLGLIGVVSTVALCQQSGLRDFEPVEIQRLQAEELSRFDADEAVQGAAVDGNYFYAIVNTAIGKYDRQTGEPSGRFATARNGLVRHLNSCMAETGRLLCANSNFPEVPMASSIEIFDTATMTHTQTFSLGLLEEGSLTWFDRLGDGWLAGFAHYSTNGGLAYKDQSFSSVVRYDGSWRRLGGWMLPESVISRMDPMAASGGALGPDGLLYLTGHDRPEMYVLAAPAMGPKLVHIATIEIELEGQAFAWDRTATDRVVYGISRPSRQVRSFRIPVVEIPAGTTALTSERVLLGPGGL